jgi:hypothetical protein
VNIPFMWIIALILPGYTGLVFLNVNYKAHSAS